MPNYQSSTIVGHLGREPEKATTPTGKEVVKLSVAVTTRRKDKEDTLWWGVSVWSKPTQEYCLKYLKKGQPVLCAGEFTVRAFQKDGELRASADMNANTVQGLARSDREEGEERRPAPAPAANKPEPPFGQDEDIPF